MNYRPIIVLLLGLIMPLVLPAQRWQDVSSFKEMNNIYFAQKPNIKACREGQLSPVFLQKTIDYINYIRSLHGLLPVVPDTKSNVEAQKAALMLAVNKTVNHHPPKSWKCYSKEGVEGCATSNLFAGSGFWGMARAIEDWLTDEGIANLGHRRWLLTPSLKSVGVGFVSDSIGTGAALKVMKTAAAYSAQELSITPKTFVAYPFQQYPSYLVNKDWLLSFTVPIPKGVSFDQAKITIKSNNQIVNISEQQTDYEPYGGGATLLWKIPNLVASKRYEVRVDNVYVNGQPQAYHYWFEIVP